MSEKKTPFKKVDNLINKTSKSLSKNKVDRLLKNCENEYDLKMLRMNIHYLRLKLRNPDFKEFCEYVGF